MATTTTTWTDAAIREANRQSSANGRISGYAQRIWREQGYDEDTVQHFRRGLLTGLHTAQREYDARAPWGGTPDPATGDTGEDCPSGVGQVQRIPGG